MKDAPNTSARLFAHAKTDDFFQKLSYKQTKGLNFPPEKYLFLAPTLDAMTHEQVVQAVRLGKLTVQDGLVEELHGVAVGGGCRAVGRRTVD